MKKLKRILSVFLAVAMLVCAVPVMEVGATQSKSENFSSNYSLNNIGADDMLSIAQAQLGKTKNQLGYTERWCADFVADCAKLAGQSSAIAANGAVSSMRTQVINAGGQSVSSRQKGDLVFYYCSSCGRYVHVGIVLDGNYSIEGNYDGKVSRVENSYTDSEGHKISTGKISRSYVRPAYKSENPQPSDYFVSYIDDAPSDWQTFDKATTSSFHVRGWAFRNNNVLTRTYYTFDDVGYTQMTPINRDDVLSVYGNTQQDCGFDQNIDISGLSVGNHTFKIWASSNGVDHDMYYIGVTITDSTPETFFLDINGLIDGVSKSNVRGYGTYDVYINGKLESSNAADFAGVYPKGTLYEIKNIQANSCYKYKGAIGNLKGSLTNSVNIVLKYSSIVLDLNALVDGEAKNNTRGYGTYDVYINGELKSEGASDFAGVFPTGTIYEIKNIQAKPGYVYNGVSSGSLTGTINDSVIIVLVFSSAGSLDLNGIIDEEEKNNIRGFGTYDVYINGSIVSKDASDFAGFYPTGTVYEIKNIKVKPGYIYKGVVSGDLKGTITGAVTIVLCFTTDPSYTTDYSEPTNLEEPTDITPHSDPTDPTNPTNPTNPTQPTNPAPQPQQSGSCRYCGGTHTGFPGVLIGFFHSILALFGLRK